MANESTRIHTPGDTAPSVTYKVAKCQVCGVQWQVQGDWVGEMGCAFCDAPPSAITISSEKPGYDGRVV